MHELERKMEEKERELHAIRLDSEAVSMRFCCLSGILASDPNVTFVELKPSLLFSRFGPKRIF